MADVLDLRNKKTENAPPTEQVKKPAATPSETNSASALTWKAPEYIYYEKSTDWYWALGIVTIGLLAVAVIMSNFLFAVLVLLGGFTLAMFGARKPRVANFSISVEGIRVDNTLYPYESLKSFWIFYDPPFKELSIESQKLILPHIKIPLDTMNPVEIRAYLLQFLPEKKQEESLIDHLANYLKF